MKEICLDTGILTLFLEEKCSQQIEHLLESIRNNEIDAIFPKSLLSEVYFHLCKKKGRDYASSKLISLLDKYPLHLMDYELDILIKAGELKCQNRDLLSYNDCLLLAICLIKKIPLHTTEDFQSKIPRALLQRLNLIKYTFQE
jgi:predicted nucleic acid-binding protein